MNVNCLIETEIKRIETIIKCLILKEDENNF